MISPPSLRHDPCRSPFRPPRTPRATGGCNVARRISRAGRSVPRKKPWYRQLYFQVLVAIVIGVVVGWRWPDVGEAMEPIGTTFIAAMKMLIGPIVFLTIVGGIASVADLKKVGLTGIKALTYFQIGTILAMVTGLVAINVFRLGDGVNADASHDQGHRRRRTELHPTGETRSGGSSSPTSSRTASSARSSRATSCRSSSWP